MNSRKFRKRYEDRITNLPSSLKTKILSCLPTKDAVKTSVLSRKWKRSWTWVTNLDFDDNLVWNYRDGDEEDMISQEDYIRFVNRVLLLHDRSSLQRFHMRCRNRYKGSLVNTWITAVLLCHVQELHISVTTEPPTLLTSDIFTCKTLVVLKLDPKGHVNMPASVCHFACLPNLKILHLANLRLFDDVSIMNLLSGCSVLEELNLRRCISNDVCVVNVIVPTLTNLTLEHLRNDLGSHGVCRYEIVLDTPALKSLNLSDCEAKGYVVKNLNQLMKAVITVGDPYTIYGHVNDRFPEIRSKAITDFLNGISDVRSLILSAESMRAIHSYEPALPIFSDLTFLELTKPHNGWRALPKLLKNSPSLETLILHQKIWRNDDHIVYGFYDDVDYFLRDEVPSCFLSHLKVIKIDDFEWHRDEMRLIEYFLENAKVLEKLTIDYRPRSENSSHYTCPGEYTNGNDKYYKDLLMMKRGSKLCKVEVL